jgi:hypothetical protein
VRRIAQFLQLSISEDVIDSVDAETNIEAVRKKTAELAAGDADVLTRAGKSQYDSESQYHLNHASKGALRDWRAELSADEQSEALAILARWLPEPT